MLESINMSESGSDRDDSCGNFRALAQPAQTASLHVVMLKLMRCQNAYDARAQSRAQCT